MPQTVTEQVRRDLLADPATPNFVLVQRYGCTNGLVSKIRKQVGLPWRSWKTQPRTVVLPEYMMEALSRMAYDAGADVTVHDLVLGILDDAIAEVTDPKGANL